MLTKMPMIFKIEERQKYLWTRNICVYKDNFKAFHFPHTSHKRTSPENYQSKIKVEKIRIEYFGKHFTVKTAETPNVNNAENNLVV